MDDYYREKENRIYNRLVDGLAVTIILGSFMMLCNDYSNNHSYRTASKAPENNRDRPNIEAVIFKDEYDFKRKNR